MKKNWKYVRTGGWLIALLLLFSACKDKQSGHSQHEGTATEWQCPMKCEGDKTYHEPGKCPVCKMDLKPVEMPDGHDHSTMNHGDSSAVFTCPMHPEIQRNEPGSCPICGMDLVKKKSDEAAAAPVGDSLDFLLKPTYEYVLGSVKTVRPLQKSLTTALEVPGYLAYDARKVNVVSARFGGRIERLYVKYPYQPVRKGQRILDIYSPEIATAQQELIFLLESDAANSAMIENARRRLSLLGLTAEQIRSVEKSRNPNLSLPIFSPYAGLVFEKPMPVPSPNTAEDGMGADASAVPATLPAGSGELSLREGMYLQKGQRLFSVQSLSTVWAVLEFYPSDVSAVKIGQSVSIQIEPFDTPFLGKINYVEPQFGSGRKSVRARVYLDNPGNRLKPGALLQATVRANARSGIWIPVTAVLDLGSQKVVFVKKDGGFKTTTIQAGIRSGDWLELLSGISEEDEVAENAQFLMDSESFVKVNF